MSTLSYPPLDPLLYHAHHLLRADDLPFWQTLAEEYADPVLELGCGTGRILLPLAPTGKHLTGLDADPAMLAYFRTALPPHGYANLHLHQGDMRNFHFDQSFNLVLLPCNPYSTF
ncbi:MAG TPA: class I SAM-dependent methyltransferase, partial [Anaerolineales bacterium]|nr:class I SAM-dependent methyltransferase [Anaerolineales bacterium]